MFAATLTSSSGVHRRGGSFGLSTLGPYISSNLNSARKRELKKKKTTNNQKDYSMA